MMECIDLDMFKKIINAILITSMVIPEHKNIKANIPSLLLNRASLWHKTIMKDGNVTAN